MMAALKSAQAVGPVKRKRKETGPGEARVKKPKTADSSKVKSASFVKGKNMKAVLKGDGSKSKLSKFSTKGDQDNGNSSKVSTESGSFQGQTYQPQKTEKPLDRKARKELAEYRKKQRRPNYDLEKEVKTLWEKMRQRNLEAAERTKLVSETLAKMKGKLLEMASSHISSRVLQSCVKHCQKSERDAVFEELRPHILVLARDTYAYHLVIRMLDHASKSQMQQILSVLHGNVVSLLRHPVGSPVVEHAYQLANGTQKKELVSEFYSPEFRLFKGVAAVKGGVKELMTTEPVSKQNAMMEHMMMALQPILEKGVVDHSITHRALIEYLSVCKRSLAEDVVKSLASPSTSPVLVRMIHTKDGAKIGVTCINLSTAKERKNIIRGMKGHVFKIATDECSSTVLLAILELVDDTKLVSKVIIGELVKELKALISHKYGRRCLLQLLAPGVPRYFPADVLAVLQHPVGVHLEVAVDVRTEDIKESTPLKAKKSKKKHNAKENVDQMNEDTEEGAKDMEEGNSDEDTETAVNEVRGVSKKNPSVRRQELLLGGGLGKKLVELCTQHAYEFLQCPVASDVIYEVAMGGLEGVLWKIAPDQLVYLHKVIADLAAKPSVTVEEAKTEGEHVLEQYHASRTLRRLILNSQPPPDGINTPSIASTLWTVAFKGKCKLWAKGHSAKVVAVYSTCADAKAKEAAHAEIQKLIKAGLVKPQQN